MTIGANGSGAATGISGQFGWSQQYGNVKQLTNKSKKISQEGYDKIIYDILSSDQGLAALSSGENASGGFGSTTKALMAQDMTAKLAGELALLQAENVEYSDQRTDMDKDSQNIGAGVGTVICTELVRQGKLDRNLYEAGHAHFLSLNPLIVSGYQWWAIPMVARMKNNEVLSNFFLPVAKARYQYLVLRKTSILGVGSVIIGHPVCFLLGLLREVITSKVENLNGRAV
jgi:hypothetical protein